MCLPPFRSEDRALILGATGFVGSRLIPELSARSVRLRLFVRDPVKEKGMPRESDIEIAEGDLLTARGLGEALSGIHTAYYLVHSMGGSRSVAGRGYAERDRIAAQNFIEAARASGLRRVIYLGALGEEGVELSEHLRSRAEIAKILASGGPAATILRAAVIIGAGGASFEMLRYLVERLPVMACPKWIDSRIQPIALRDVLAYLAGCLFHVETAGKTLDIGGPEVMTYREMMQRYAEARGLARRLIFRVPLLTPLLSAYWVDLVTPVDAAVAHPLIEGLRNDVICRDDSIDALLPITKTPFREAVQQAFLEETDGPGVTGF